MVEVSQIVKTFPSGGGEISVLRGVTLALPQGKSAAVTGESGSGKSTLLNIIGGLDKPDEGTVHSYGFAVHDLKEKGLTSYRAWEVGFIFQFHYLLKDFTALENVMLPALMAGRSRKEAEEKARELLLAVRLSDRGSHYPSQLSGGERQRTALARALINDPSLVLADEPTGNLDEDHKERIAQLLFSLVSERKKSLLLVTHDNTLASRADVHFVLKEGRLQSL